MVSVGIVPIGVCFSLSMSTDDDEEEENAVATLTTNLLLDADADDLFGTVVLLEYYRDAMRRDVECERRGGQSRGFQSEGPMKHNL